MDKEDGRMILEIFGLYALAIFALIFYAETGKRPEVGVVGALVILVLAVSVATDGVQIANGQSISTNSTFNSSTNETITTMNVTTNHTELAVPYIDFKTVFGLVAALIAVFMLLYYGLGVGDTGRGS